ncbi:MAG: hypothetical protein QOD04_3074 [Pseudonocardiales bacterium]|nr:hypothetical protein [Pseudonocardiales bacterium]
MRGTRPTDRATDEDHPDQATRCQPRVGSARPRSLPDVRAGVHISALYSRPGERDALLYPYLHDGLVHAQRCTAYLAGGARQTLLNRLSTDIDVEAVRSSGQLDVRNAAEQPFTSDISYAEAASHLWEGLVAQRGRGEFHFARFTVETTRWLPHLRRPHELLRFESQLTSLALGHPITLMFMYDLSDLDGALIIELARTHQTLWACGVALANPYYTAT